MRVDLETSGGIAGLVRTGTLDTGELPPDEAARAEAALGGLRWDPPWPGADGGGAAPPADADRGGAAAPAPSPPPGADRLQHQLTTFDAGGRPRVAVLQEPDLPSDLRPLLAELRRRSHLTP